MASSKCIEDRLPDRETQYGRAWRVDLSVATNGPHASVAAWIVEAPWAHPFWSNYLISVSHLRPVSGLTDPKIYVDGASHEIVLHALNPDVAPSLVRPASTILAPANFAAQWVAGGDIDADGKIEQCVERILDRTLSPDTDAISQWIQLFNGAMLK